MSDDLPKWLSTLDAEDLQFLRRFLLASGSLKAVAEQYGISYPTVRGRLDRLIAKVEAASDPRSQDAFDRTVRIMVAGGTLDSRRAGELLRAHREVVETLRRELEGGRAMATGTAGQQSRNHDEELAADDTDRADYTDQRGDLRSPFAKPEG